MSGWLKDQVCLVTGGARGIGQAVARRYLKEGAAGVILVDRNFAKESILEKEYRGRVFQVEGDVRTYQTHETAVSLAIKHFGRLDVAVANAGVFDFRRPLRSYTAPLLQETMEELFAVNLRGYLYTALASRKSLLASRGSMIFTASVASFNTGGGGILYTISKHAVVGLIRQLALEMAPDVRVNGVGPGGTLTELGGTTALNHEQRTINSKGDLAQRISAAVPLRFAQEPEDHTGLYVLLASRANSRAITGEVFMSDGGVGIRPA